MFSQKFYFSEPVYSRITNSSSQQSLSQQQQPPTAVACGSSSIYGAATPGCQLPTASSQQQSLYSQVVAYHFCQVSKKVDFNYIQNLVFYIDIFFV